ncbi:hypothetical protein Tco_1580215, partial [Tanacetum coccineum]
CHLTWQHCPNLYVDTIQLAGFQTYCDRHNKYHGSSREVTSMNFQPNEYTYNFMQLQEIIGCRLKRSLRSRPLSTLYKGSDM